MNDRNSLDRRAKTVRFWTALIIYAGAGWATVEVLLAVREHFGLPEALGSVFIALFVAGFLATIILLKTRIAGDAPPVLHALRAFAVVLLFAAIALLVAYWLAPEAGTGERSSLLALPCEYDGDADHRYPGPTLGQNLLVVTEAVDEQVQRRQPLLQTGAHLLPMTRRDRALAPCLALPGSRISSS